jgi:hypothetical protein
LKVSVARYPPCGILRATVKNGQPFKTIIEQKLDKL